MRVRRKSVHASDSSLMLKGERFSEKEQLAMSYFPGLARVTVEYIEYIHIPR